MLMLIFSVCCYGTTNMVQSTTTMRSSYYILLTVSVQTFRVSLGLDAHKGPLKCYVMQWGLGGCQISQERVL